MHPDLPSDITVRQLAYDATREAEWHALLSLDEHRRMETYTHAKRRREFLLGRVAARTLLAEQLALDPKAVPLQVAEDGAPEVPTPAVHVSIAHSGDKAVAAAGRRPVGIDLEHIQPRHTNLHRFLLHESEVVLLDQLPMPREQALILCWTLKEATLKGLRTGFRLSPKKLRLSIDAVTSTASVAIDGQGTWQARFVEQDGAYLALAFPG